MMSKTVDYLIVGQGLAGTLLTHFLLEAGQTVMVLNEVNPSAASNVAAGIINPITGRRYLKSWRIDELIPFAEKTYRTLETQLGVSFFNPRGIIRAMFTAGAENDWLSRTAQPGYEAYIADDLEMGTFRQYISPARAFGEILQGAQVDLPTLLTLYRQYLEERDCYHETSFDYSQLQLHESGVTYQEFKAKRLVFCEGINAKQNPFFNYLPFQGAKGEVLIIRITETQFEKILKHKLFIVPLGDDLYWIGSTYDNHFTDPGPTEAGKDRLLKKLEEMLQAPFEIIHHRAAVRPTVRDRRPFLGVHPKFEQLYIFNGLGTKGSSLGPFWASEMVQYLTKIGTLDEAVDIGRFVGMWEP